MNLELLDPFRRQIPDRVDATLTIPSHIHTRHLQQDSSNTTSTLNTGGSGSKKQQPHQQDAHDDEDWKAAYHVSYNRRGTYIATGYASGVVGVHDVLSRTLNAVYPGDQGHDKNAVDEDSKSKKKSQKGGSSMSTPPPKKLPQEQELGNGVTSLSWSRRSRTLLAGAVGDTLVRLYDTTHPYGPEECTICLMADEKDNNADHHHDKDDNEKTHGNPRSSPSNASHQVSAGGDRPSVRNSTFSNVKSSYLDYAKDPRMLKTKTITFESQPGDRSATPIESSLSSKSTTTTMYPSLYFNFPNPVAGSLEVHPKYTTAGLAVLSDGSLVLFWIPESAWWKEKSAEKKKRPTPRARLWTLWNDTESSLITCASFDPIGERIYAATKEGTLMGFEVGSVLEAITASTSQQIPACEKQCRFTIRIPGNATVWQLIVSRNGKFFVVNSSDGALRLYNTKDCWDSPEDVERPSQVFQDVVNKVKFVSCDVSGDGEYLVGGANGISDDRYELYIWNTSTGALMDKLTGAPVQLYSVAWHPTRSFLAIAASDGLIDVWGPRINWTAFAPDFQALPMNVEYVEREDEFDLDEDGNKIEDKEEKDAETDDERALVDVVTVERVPVFASDSEDEGDVFHFETKFANMLGGRAGRHGMSLHEG